MSAKPSSSKERIIPIAIENSEDSMSETESSQCFLDIGNNSLQTNEEDDEEELQTVGKTKKLPVCNAREKIILAIDSTEDENFTPFRLANGKQNKPLDAIRRAIEIFLQSKQAFDKKHEYALVVLYENSVEWLVNFTSNINDIVNALHKINPCDAEDIFNLDALFNNILENVDIPDLCEINDTIMPPPYIFRTILVYGRSYTLPQLSKNENIVQLLKSPYFTLDVLMTHEVVDNNNNCNKIFQVLQNIDKKGLSYFLPVGRDMKMLLNSIGMLLGHPLQRPTQSLAKFSIK